MGLEKKTYDRIDREVLWSVLRLYGIGGRKIEGIESFYVNSRACMRVRNMSAWACQSRTVSRSVNCCLSF